MRKRCLPIVEIRWKFPTLMHPSVRELPVREEAGRLARNARPLPDDLGIDAERRIELGVEVAI